ncbi:MAG: superoxide dismutase family protein [Ruminococcus sp.]|nr:superoxide dismutase family protein [Ruminococcus sp.]MDE6678192.1 superoxide dismutase family protein [Ruminococcus sp.]
MFPVSKIICRCPCCKAVVRGSEMFPALHGEVSFFNVHGGTLVVTEIFGLPTADGIYAMHIHNGKECTGSLSEPFSEAGSHLNPDNNSHPFHMGDLPVIFSNNGYSWSAIYTNRFRPSQVKDYTVIIHKNTDDYRSQPSGNSGERIACGEIR